MKNTIPACFLLLLLAVFAVPSGCYYDNEEDLYGGPGGCDTTDVRYSVDVLNILENQCYSCHTTSSNVAGSPFETYSALKVYADNGKLVSLINTPGVNQMPPTGLLPECDRRKIEAWVKAGAPDN
jgi:hypothetical protein